MINNRNLIKNCKQRFKTQQSGSCPDIPSGHCWGIYLHDSFPFEGLSAT